MKIALISDIHGHAVALEAVLADIAFNKVDRIVCLGDVATIGPQPKEVIRRLIGLECPCITGNHEAALIEPDKALQYDIAPPLLPALNWCTEQLENIDREFLAATVAQYEIDLDRKKKLFCFHGSPRAHTDIIMSDTPSDMVTNYLQNTSADIYAGGHTHFQMLRQHDGKVIINPGSVGAPFRRIPDPGTEPALYSWAEYGMIESDGPDVRFELCRVRFDTSAFIKILRASDLPVKDWWLKQYRPL